MRIKRNYLATLLVVGPAAVAIAAATALAASCNYDG